jgi:hypothetical protein
MRNVIPAKVQSIEFQDSSSDESVMSIEQIVRPQRESRLPELIHALEISRPVSPAFFESGNRGRHKLSRESVLGAQALVSLIHQAEVRILAKAVRHWHLKPVRLRSEAIQTRLKNLEAEMNRQQGVCLLLQVLSRTVTVRSSGEFFIRTKLMGTMSESDAEWESASEHIQKLRDLLAVNILTNVVDKWQLRTLASTLIELNRVQAELIE